MTTLQKYLLKQTSKQPREVIFNFLSCKSLGHLQNRKTSESRKWEKNRPKIGKIDQKQAKNRNFLCFSSFSPIFWISVFFSIPWMAKAFAILEVIFCLAR